jgi:copper chaperone
MGDTTSVIPAKEAVAMVTISIPNMTCGGCAKGVLATLRDAAPGAAATVDLGTRQVSVDAPDASPLVAALRADGWRAEAGV